jgi:hypothetical protein
MHINSKYRRYGTNSESFIKIGAQESIVESFIKIGAQESIV